MNRSGYISGDSTDTLSEYVWLIRVFPDGPPPGYLGRYAAMTSQVEHVGTYRRGNRELYVLDLVHADDLLTEFDAVAGYAVILIVWDSTDVESDTIRRLSQRMLDAGGAFFCTWGPGCDRVHDLIDDEICCGNRKRRVEEGIVLTTWHANESLAEIIWFTLAAAQPDQPYADHCRSVIAICIGCPQWAVEVRRAFADPEQFCDSLVDS